MSDGELLIKLIAQLVWCGMLTAGMDATWADYMLMCCTGISSL